MKKIRKKTLFALCSAIIFAIMLFAVLYGAAFSRSEQDPGDESPWTAESLLISREYGAAIYQDPAAVKSLAIDCSDFEQTHPESDTEADPIALSVASQSERRPTGIDDWYYSNKLYLPMIGMEWDIFFDEEYIYRWMDSYAYPSLTICDRETGIQLYEALITTELYKPTANNAYLKDGILYAGCIGREDAPSNTCFMFAYDLENDRLVWRSRDKTYNTSNFIVKDGLIICGFGGTGLTDYIYQIDINTGEIVWETQILSAPYLLVESGEQLYVSAYEHNYIFNMT